MLERSQLTKPRKRRTAEAREIEGLCDKALASPNARKSDGGFCAVRVGDLYIGRAPEQDTELLVGVMEDDDMGKPTTIYQVRPDNRYEITKRRDLVDHTLGVLRKTFILDVLAD